MEAKTKAPKLTHSQPAMPFRKVTSPIQKQH